MIEIDATVRDETIVADAPSAVPPTAPSTAEVTATAYDLMLRRIRSWGLWSLGWGVMHVVGLGALSAPFGILLLLVGLASFYFREAAMFVVYGVTLAWAATSNMLSGEASWIGLGLVQLVFVYRIFRQFFHFRRVQADHAELTADTGLDSPPAPERAPHIFPWLAALLGPLALAGLVASFVGSIMFFALTGAEELPDVAYALVDSIFNLGVLALALGLASLLCGFRYKALAIVGVAAGALQLVIWLGLVLL